MKKSEFLEKKEVIRENPQKRSENPCRCWNKKYRTIYKFSKNPKEISFCNDSNPPILAYLTAMTEQMCVIQSIKSTQEMSA